MEEPPATMETSAMNAYVYSWKNPKKFFLGEGQYDYIFMCLVSPLTCMIFDLLCSASGCQP